MTGSDPKQPVTNPQGSGRLATLKTHGRARTALLLLAFLLAPQAHSEVTKLAFPSDSGLDFVWWPNLTVPANWEQDYDASVANAINILVPSGGSFSDADTIIYARAFFLETPGTPQTLRAFIDRDFESHKSFDPTLRIAESAPLKIADGTGLEAHTFFPEQSGSWEKVAYGEDGQFYIIFVLSSRSQQGFEDALSDYALAVESYTREPEDPVEPVESHQSE